MKPLRIVRIISGLWIGGVERKIASMMISLKEHGYDVSVICLREEGALAHDLRSAGVPVEVVRVRRRLSPAGLWKLRTYLRTIRPDIVHTHMYRSNTTGAIASALAGVPIVINQIHNVDAWDDRGQILMDRLLVPLKDMFVFVSEAVRLNYTSRIRIPEELQRVIYNGIDTSRFSPARDNPMNLEGSPRLGVATRLVEQKGIDSLIPLMPTWLHHFPDLHLYLMGDGPQRQSLEAAIQKAGLSNSIRILGFSDRVHEFLRSLDLYVMPSLKEGFSNALLEAMASGLPCVTTDVGGNREAIENEISGIIVPPGNPNAFHQAVQLLLDSPAIRLSMGNEARRRAIEFSLRRMVEKTIGLYEEMASRAL